MAGNRNSGGHNRKPASVKKREGNVGHARKVPHVRGRDPDRDIPPWPIDFQSDELYEAKMALKNPYPRNTPRHNLWDKLSTASGGPDLDLSRLEAMLEAAVETWQEHREICAIIADEGVMISDRDGIRRKHPLLGPRNQTLTSLAKMMAALGLTRDAADILFDSDAHPVNGIGHLMAMEKSAKERTDWAFDNHLRAVKIRKEWEDDKLQ